MSRVDGAFKDRVYEIVAQIPTGRVMTYGQIAAYCGAAWAAWKVGQLAHYGPENLPWHRVVNKQGGLARGFVPGGREQQKMLLELEGVTVDKEYQIKIEAILWTPAAEPRL